MITMVITHGVNRNKIGYPNNFITLLTNYVSVCNKCQTSVSVTQKHHPMLLTMPIETSRW